MTRDEVARRVAERLGLEPPQALRLNKSYAKLWDALISAELQREQAERRVEELEKALRKIASCKISGGCSTCKRVARAALSPKAKEPK